MNFLSWLDNCIKWKMISLLFFWTEFNRCTWMHKRRITDSLRTIKIRAEVNEDKTFSNKEPFYGPFLICISAGVVKMHISMGSAELLPAFYYISFSKVIFTNAPLHPIYNKFCLFKKYPWTKQFRSLFIFSNKVIPNRNQMAQIEWHTFLMGACQHTIALCYSSLIAANVYKRTCNKSIKQ